MLSTLFAWIMAEAMPWLIAAALGLVGLVAGDRLGRRAARREAETEGLRDEKRRVEKGREAVAGGRAGGGEPDERLRANDGRW